jgi:hypothetical protein
MFTILDAGYDGRLSTCLSCVRVAASTYTLGDVPFLFGISTPEGSVLH